MAAISYIPNKGDGQSDLQSHVFSLDFEVQKAAELGIDGIISGCELTQQGTPDMTVAVATGVVVSNGKMYTVTAGNATIGTADGTNPRVDLVVVNSSGSIAVRAGTAAAFPLPPARTANDVVLGYVYVPASDTTITDDQITRGRLALTSGPRRYLIRQDASRTLTSSTTEQQLFDGSTNGRVTLPVGLYYFRCQYYISGLSATSGNLAFDILGAGSATVGTPLYHVVGIDGNSNTAATQTGSTSTNAQSPASAVTAGTGTATGQHITGTFEVTAAGTIQPAVTLVTASAGTVAAGSYFMCWREGGTSVSTIGPWD